uniref:Uncharacterized protein n=1 Tax=Caenorhabditis japonica TaxID=281687 RepID=A0A8R1IM22_CAEJA
MASAISKIRHLLKQNGESFEDDKSLVEGWMTMSEEDREEWGKKIQKELGEADPTADDRQHTVALENSILCPLRLGPGNARPEIVATPRRLMRVDIW